jgi:hypothetical protein
MIKIHLLSRISSEIISYWMEKCPIREYSLTTYEAQLFHLINIFHSNGFFSINNQLDYSKLESASITPLNSFLKFYQLTYSNSQLINSNQFHISSNLSSTCNKSITGKVFIHKTSKRINLLSLHLKHTYRYRYSYIFIHQSSPFSHRLAIRNFLRWGRIF